MPRATHNILYIMALCVFHKPSITSPPNSINVCGYLYGPCGLLTAAGRRGVPEKYAGGLGKGPRVWVGHKINLSRAQKPALKTWAGFAQMQVPTQYKATQLVVALAVWAT
jgi:hypothetical protein